LIVIDAIAPMDQVKGCIRELLLPESGPLNEAKARALVTLLHQRKNLMSPAFDFIRSTAVGGSRQLRFRCLPLIDFLFRNGNRTLLGALQCSPLVTSLGEDPIVGDPLFHRDLCQHVWSWRQCLDAARAVTPQFEEWRARVAGFRFRYVLTQKAADKFCADFAAAFELLSIFNEAIVAAALESGGRGDIREMLPNVAEVHQRLLELRSWMADKYLLSVIDYLLAYCELCRAAYTQLANRETVNVGDLAEIAERGIPEPPKPPAIQAPHAAQTVVNLSQPEYQMAPPAPGLQQAARATHAPYQNQARQPSGRATQQQPVRHAAPAKPPGRQVRGPPKTDLGFDCDDDVSDDGLSNAEFAAFLDTLSSRKR
jgi:hypothetical protein